MGVRPPQVSGSVRRNMIDWMQRNAMPRHLLCFTLVLMGTSSSCSTFGSPNHGGTTATCDDRWLLFSMQIGLPKQDALSIYPAARLKHDQRGRPYYRVLVRDPIIDLDAHRARLSFWFDASDNLIGFTARLRGAPAYEQVAEYFEHRFGRPRLLSSSTYGTWWGGLRSTPGVAWATGCGIYVRLERERFGRARLEFTKSDDRLSATRVHDDESSCPPNNRLKLTARGRSEAAGSPSARAAA